MNLLNLYYDQHAYRNRSLSRNQLCLDQDFEPPEPYAVVAIVELDLDAGIRKSGAIPGPLAFEVGTNPLETLERINAAPPVLLPGDGPSLDVDTFALCQ